MTPTGQTEKLQSKTTSCVRTPSSAKKQLACAHCGRPVQKLASSAQKQIECQASFTAAELRLEPRPEPEFCCAGCEKVYAFLKEARYAKYYELLSQLAQHAPAQEQQGAAHEDLSWKSPKAASWPEFQTQTQSQIHTSFAAYSHPALTEVFERRPGELMFFVPGLRCAACIWLIEKALGSVGGVLEVRVSLLERMVYVNTASQNIASTESSVCQELALLLEKLGYKPFPPQLAGWDESQKGLSRSAAKELGIAGALFGNVMLLATGTYFGALWGMNETMHRFFNILMFIMGTGALLFPGGVFFKTAWNAVKIRKLHIDLPISIALAVTYFTSVYGVFADKGEIYFDSLTGLIFLLLSARAMQNTLLVRAKRLAGYASALLPEQAFALTRGTELWVSLGEHFPADGTILEGQTEVNEAALTGESLPVLKKPGSEVLAGTQNMLAPVRMRVLRAGSESFVGKLLELVADAKLRKGEFQIYSEKVLPYFIAFTIVSGVGAAIWWFAHDAAKAPAVLAAVLIVACPCAIALSVPLTMATALSRAWKAGFVIKGADVLERLNKVDAVVLDKTGTLTTGEFQIMQGFFYEQSSGEWLPFEPGDAALQEPQAAALLKAGETMAQKSKHPMARALAKHLKDSAIRATHALSNDGPMSQKPEVQVSSDHEGPREGLELEEIPGKGMRARFLGLGQVVLGNPSLVAELDSTSAGQIKLTQANAGSESVLYLCCGAVALSFVLKDSLRCDAALFVNELLERYPQVHIATGDSFTATQSFAKQLKAKGVRQSSLHWHAALLPSQKLELVEKLKSSGHRVLMFGDGVNDGPALACADVGLAVSGGVDMALSAADILCLRPDLCGVLQSINWAKHTQTTLKIVVAISIFYNVVAVALALTGILHPLIAALIMPASSLSTALVVACRKGTKIWKSCTYSSPLPWPLLLEA